MYIYIYISYIIIYGDMYIIYIYIYIHGVLYDNMLKDKGKGTTSARLDKIS